MRVRWTDTAIGHLTNIHAYVAADSDVYATRLVDRLTRLSTQIAEFPESGRIVPEFDRADVREVIEKPYRVIYLIRHETIDVLAVVHGAMELPPIIEPLPPQS